MASIPAKKRKSRGGETLTLEDVKTLGHQLLSSRSHLNNLPILVSFVSPSSPLELALESLISLQSFFVPLIPEIPPSSVKFAAPDEKDPDSVYRAWLRSNFDEFVGSLIGIAISPQSTEVLRDVALDAIMDFVKLGKGGRFQSAIYHKFLQSIVRATSYADPLLDLLVPKYFKYIDVRFIIPSKVNRGVPIGTSHFNGVRGCEVESPKSKVGCISPKGILGWDFSSREWNEGSPYSSFFNIFFSP